MQHQQRRYRPAELHVSALSPAEFGAYTRYLDLLALSQARNGDAGLGADGSVRFDRVVVNEFAVERLGVPNSVVDDVLDLVNVDKLAANQVYAVFRLLAHVAPSPRSPRSARPPRAPPKMVDHELVFVPVDPLPLDPEVAPPAPPRRVPSISASASASTSSGGPTRASPLPAPKPTLPPRRLSPPPSPPPARAAARKSLPAGHSLDPFRDTPSPTTSPAKTRTYSTSSIIGTVGSNNPFRLGPTAAAPAPLIPLEYNAPTSKGPPLPPRKPSIRRPGPALPPRQPSNGPKTRVRGDSLSSGSSASYPGISGSGIGRQPTRTAPPSELMQQSLAAAAASSSDSRTGRTARENSELEVIRSSSAPTASGAEVMGRRDIIETVTRAVRESEVDCLPPPQRVASSGSRPKPLPSTSPSGSGAFNMVAEQYRQKYPGIKTWSTVGLLNDRPLRSAFALIILNVPITRRDTLLRAWSSSTVRFCADGGANRLYDALDSEDRATFLPTMIKGDLDSIRPEVRAYYTTKGVAIKKDPSEYSTDLMKCVEEVESLEKASGKHFSLLFFGGLGGRFDQTIHTTSILLKFRVKRPDTYVISDDSLAWVLDKGVHLVDIDHTTMGETCGILPVGVSEAFVRTEGLKWNLDWVTSLEGELSSSNHLLPSEPAVLLETSAPIFWTVEIRPLTPPIIRSPMSPADELSRGVKELGVGFVRAAGGVAQGVNNLGRRLSRQGIPPLNGSSSGAPNGAGGGDYRVNSDREREAASSALSSSREQQLHHERELWERERRERAGLVGSRTGDSDSGPEGDGDGYAQLD